MMKCPHCGVGVDPLVIGDHHFGPAGKIGTATLSVIGYRCTDSDCKRIFVFLHSTAGWKRLVHPKSARRQRVPREVPPEIAEDYNEACLVFAGSAKASAALSRRCLQNLLRAAAEVKPSDLSKEIQEVLDKGALPSHLAENIDAIRNIGNFGAHPIKCQHTGEIVCVEPGEAEWTLDVLEALFDFFYVQPAVLKKKRADLDRKLKAAGKPPMK